MTQPQDPTERVSTRLLEVISALTDFLIGRQGQGPMHAEDIAREIRCSRSEVYRAVEFIAETVPDCPLISSRRGYEMTWAWDSNIRFHIVRFRTILTLLRRTRNRSTLVLQRRAAREAGFLSTQASFLLRFEDRAAVAHIDAISDLIEQLEASLV